jgi:hypothetical protein
MPLGQIVMRQTRDGAPLSMATCGALKPLVLGGF